MVNICLTTHSKLCCFSVTIDNKMFLSRTNAWVLQKHILQFPLCVTGCPSQWDTDCTRSQCCCLTWQTRAVPHLKCFSCLQQCDFYSLYCLFSIKIAFFPIGCWVKNSLNYWWLWVRCWVLTLIHFALKILKNAYSL